MPSRFDLISELIRLHNEYDRTPTQALMVGQGSVELRHYQDEFGSWEQALRVVGFDPASRDAERYDILTDIPNSQILKLKPLLESNEPKEFFRGQLLAELHRLAVELDKSPSSTDMKNYGRYSVSVYRNHFGSWNEAVKEAGYEPTPRPDRVSDTELLTELQRLAEKVDEPLRSRHMRDLGQYSVHTYSTRFGSWNNARERAGV